MTTSQQFCTFLLADQLFGVPVQQVQEVLRSQDMTHVPLACTAMQGLINLRGQIVAALDLRSCLDLPGRPANQSPMNMVVHTVDGPISILVDEIGDVLELDKETFENPPPTLRGKTREMIRGVYKLPAGLLLVLDIERVNTEMMSSR